MREPPQGDAETTRNTILAVVLCAMILFGWEYFISRPQRAALEAQRAVAQAQVEQSQAAQQQATTSPQAGSGAVAQVDAAPAPLPPAPRIPFENRGAVDGTINLEGARFDDLNLKQHHQTVARLEEVSLLEPAGTDHHYDAILGWEASDGVGGVNQLTRWSAPEGAALTEDQPLVLTYADPSGLAFTRTIALDQNYMFTVTDRVTNTGEAARSLRPWGAVRRTGLPEEFKENQIVHQGMLGVFGPEPQLREQRYKRAIKHAQEKVEGKKLDDARLYEARGVGGWLGISDHYWLTALAPPQTETIDAWYDSRLDDQGEPNFRAAYRGEPRTIPPGGSLEYTQHLYSGAKNVGVLSDYQKTLSIPDLDKAVDWGNFWFLTRPFFFVLDFFGDLFGNFGLAIMATTVVVKLALFPLVNQSYEAMSKLKKVQPKMKELQERYAADKQRLQQEMMRLYQAEKVNPVAGCVPILLQIPIFYALYKVLTVTIEMRHAPFFGWVQDLSAPDPTQWVNLFGLLPFDASGLAAIPIIGIVFAVGIWPILYGVTMWGVTSLNPPAADPIQRQVFALLPFIFVFLFAGFAAGLVIYWTWSNALSFIQQYIIMRKNGVETELDKFIAQRLGKSPAGAS